MDVSRYQFYRSIRGTRSTDAARCAVNVDRVFIYHFGINNSELSWFFWIAMITLTAVTLVSDYVACSYFVKKFGGSKAVSLQQRSEC